MKLALSLGLNIALLAAAILLLRRDEAARGRSVEIAPKVSATAAQPTVAKPAPAAAPAARRTGNAHLTPEDIARFEKAGVPRNILADVMREDFRLRWNKRTAELEARFAPLPVPQREYSRLQRQQDAEQARELKAALGEEGYLAWDKEQTLRTVNFEGVPMDAPESDQVYRLQKQLDDKLHEFQWGMEDGDMDVADMTKLQLETQDAYENSLKNLLGEKRYNELKGYVVPVVEGHLEFNELTPSPEQIAALQGAASQYNDSEAQLRKRLRDQPEDPLKLAAELQKLNDARDQNFRQTLGDQAYDEVKREHDGMYQTLQQYASAWNLTDSEIQPVYSQLKAYEQKVDTLRKAAQLNELVGNDVDWNAVNAAILREQQQAQTALQNLVGPDRARRISRNGLLSPLGSDRNAPHPPSALLSSSG
jgi:hypothetical protein